MYSTLIVDDEEDIRLMLRVTLARSGDISVVAEAEDGEKALERFRELDPPPDPSVVILDHRMPGLTGLETAQRMLEEHPRQAIVLFSAHLDDHVRAKAKSIGISACLDKMRVNQLAETIREVAAAA